MAREFQQKVFWLAVVAEFLAMTIFVFIGIGSAISFQVVPTTNVTAVQDNVKVSLAFGLGITTMAQSVGHVSGAHLNPAVTLGLLVSSQISILKALLYMLAQVLGAIVASAILHAVSPNKHVLGLNQLAMNLSPGQGIVFELIITFQLVLCVLATTDKRRTDLTGSAPLAIGFSVTLGHLIAIDYTGSGMNPARSFGPAVVLRDFTNHWIYWVGPMIGGLAASLIYDFILAPRSCDLSDRMKVWASGEMEEYQLEREEGSARVEMKAK
ncbi:aquaporin-1 [Latimeria chalumnae]|uniref:aquaporin-1 n=1 Tax=Latimeria chalumnae TaxID=7897 RepID=UPI00313A9713